MWWWNITLNTCKIVKESLCMINQTGTFAQFPNFYCCYPPVWFYKDQRSRMAHFDQEQGVWSQSSNSYCFESFSWNFVKQRFMTVTHSYLPLLVDQRPLLFNGCRLTPKHLGYTTLNPKKVHHDCAVVENPISHLTHNFQSPNCLICLIWGGNSKKIFPESTCDMFLRVKGAEGEHRKVLSGGGKSPVLN